MSAQTQGKTTRPRLNRCARPSARTIGADSVAYVRVDASGGSASDGAAAAKTFCLLMHMSILDWHVRRYGGSGITSIYR